MTVRHRTIAALCAVALAFPAASTFADELVKTDGSKLSGRVIAEDAAHVTFEIQSGGMTMRQKIAREKVRSIRRDVREGPGYCAIPLFGTIGEDVTADAFEAALNATRASEPQFIVLVIDSPGGSIADMARIVQLIDARDDAEFVAYVKGRALSAAAIVALACPRIYFSPEATVGAAVPYKLGPDGIPEAIEAKIESAILAQMRASARVGGHDALWARAMSEIDVAVTVTFAEDAAARPVLVAIDDDTAGTVIKRAGQILSLTATEAVRFGLAAGTADDAAKLHAPLGLAAWHVADERPWHVMANKAQVVKAERRRDADRIDRLSAHAAYLQSVYPAVVEIDRKLKSLMAEGNAAMKAMDRLKADYKTTGEAMRAEYDAAAKRLTGGRDAAHHVAKLKDTFRARAKALTEQFEKDWAAQQAICARVAPQIQQLTARRTELTSAAPPID